MIAISDVSKSFEGRAVLSGISARVPERGTLSVLGRNSAGKSVLLKIIAGLITPDGGTVTIDGVPAGPELYAHAGADGRSPLGYVFQKGGLFDSMDLFENTAFVLRRMKLPEDEISSRVEHNLARVGLAGAERKLPAELSGGMQKRAGLARVLAVNPAVILYDDPTAGLDPILTDSIADLLLEIRETTGITSVVVTHDMKFLRRLGGEVMLLADARAVFSGGSDAFFSMEHPAARQFITGNPEGPIGGL